MLHGNLLIFKKIYSINYNLWLFFSKGVQTYDERMPIISRSSSKIMSKLSNRKVNILSSKCIYVTQENSDFFWIFFLAVSLLEAIYRINIQKPP